MKIKWDFVTNSSSTAYIVTVPKNLDISDVHTVLKDDSYYIEELGETFDDDKMKFFEAFATNIERLKKGGTYLLNYDTECFWSIKDYLQAKGLIITHIDTPGDGEDVMESVSIERLKECIAQAEGTNEN